MVKVSGWTEKEEKYLIKWWHRKSNKEIGIDLGKSETSVRNKADEIITFEMMNKRHWSEYEEKLLQRLYGTIYIEELCRRMKRTKDSIRNKIKSLEGTIDPSQLKSLYSTLQISEFLGLSDVKVRDMFNKGEIPLFKVNTWRLIIKQDDFWNWLKDNLHTPNYKKITDEAELESPEWYRKIIKEEKLGSGDGKA